MTERLSDERLLDLRRSFTGFTEPGRDIAKALDELISLRQEVAELRAVGPVMPETPSEDVVIATVYFLMDFNRDLPISASLHVYHAIRAALQRRTRASD